MRMGKLGRVFAAMMALAMLLGLGTVVGAVEPPEGEGLPVVLADGPQEPDMKEQLLGVTPHIKALESEIAPGVKSEGSISAGFSTGTTLRGLVFLLEAEGLLLGEPNAQETGVTITRPDGREDALLIEIEEASASGTSGALANFRYWFDEATTLDGQTGTIRLTQVMMGDTAVTAEEYEEKYAGALPGTIQLEAEVTARASAPWRLTDTGFTAPATGEAFTLSATAEGQRIALPREGDGDTVGTPVNFTAGALPVGTATGLQAQRLGFSYVLSFGDAYDLSVYEGLASAAGNEGWLTSWAELLTVQRLDGGSGAWQVEPVLGTAGRTLALNFTVEGQALEGFSAAVHLTALPLLAAISGEATAIAETDAEYHITGRYTGGTVTYADDRQTALANGSETTRRLIKNKDSGGEDERLKVYLGGITKEAVLWIFDAEGTGSTPYGFDNTDIVEKIGRHFITRPTAGLEGDAAPDRIWFRLRLPENKTGLVIDTLVLEDTGYDPAEMAPVGFLPPALAGTGIKGTVEADTGAGWQVVWRDGALTEAGALLYEAAADVPGVPRPAGETDTNVYMLLAGKEPMALRITLEEIPKGQVFEESALPQLLFQLADSYEEEGRVYFENSVALSAKARDYELGTVMAEGEAHSSVPYYYEAPRGLIITKKLTNLSHRGVEPGPGDILEYEVTVSLPDDVLYMRDITLYDTVGGVLELDRDLVAAMVLYCDNGSTIQPEFGVFDGGTSKKFYKNIRPVFDTWKGETLDANTMVFPFNGVLRQGDTFTLTYQLQVPDTAQPGETVYNHIRHEIWYDDDERVVRDNIHFADVQMDITDRQGNTIDYRDSVDAGTPLTLRMVAGLIDSDLDTLNSPGYRLFLRETGWLDSVGIYDVQLYDVARDTYALVESDGPLPEPLVTYFDEQREVISGWEQDPALLDKALYLRVEFPGYELANWQAIGFSMDFIAAQVEQDREYSFNGNFFGGEENDTYPVAHIGRHGAWHGTANISKVTGNLPFHIMLATRSATEKLAYPDTIYHLAANAYVNINTTDRKPSLRKAANGKDETVTLLPGDTVEYAVTLTNQPVSKKGNGPYSIWVEAMVDILPPGQQLVEGSAALKIVETGEVAFTLQEQVLPDGRTRLLVIPDTTVELERDQRLVLTYEAEYLPEQGWQGGPIETLEENLAAAYIALPEEDWRLIPELYATAAWGRDGEASPAEQRLWRDFAEIELEEELRIEVSRPVVHRAAQIEPGVAVRRVSPQPVEGEDILPNAVNGLELEWQVEALNGEGARGQIAAYDLVVQLPIGFRYKVGSAEGEEPRVETNQHGQQILLWQGGENGALPELGADGKADVRFATLVDGDRVGGHGVEAYLLPRSVAFEAGDIPEGWGSYVSADALRALGIFTGGGQQYAEYGRAVTASYGVVLYDHLGAVSSLTVGDGARTQALRRGEAAQFTFSLQSVRGSKAYEDITIMHNLPAEGDRYSFISAGRGSAFGLLLEGGFVLEIEAANGVLTTLQPDEYSIGLSPRTANGVAEWDTQDMMASFEPVEGWDLAVQPGAFKIELGRALEPGETLHVRWNMRVPEDLPTGLVESWAWASAGYTLRLAGEMARYPAEPVRAGVQLQPEEDLSLTIDKQLLDENGVLLAAEEDLAFVLELRRWRDDAWVPVVLTGGQVAGATVQGGKLRLAVPEGETGASLTISGLPEGTYSVLEDVDTTLWAPAYSPEQVQLVANGQPPLVVTNTQVSPQAATLQLTKILEGSETGGSFSIRLQRFEEGGWVPVALGGSITVSGNAEAVGDAVVFHFETDGERTAVIDGLPAGQYQVEEDDPGLGWQVTYSDPRDLVLAEGGMAGAWVSNTWQGLPKASLTLTKTVEGSEAGGVFTLYLERKEGDSWERVDLSDDPITVTGPGVPAGKGWALAFGANGYQNIVIEGLDEGTYRAEETDPGEEWLVSFGEPEGIRLEWGGHGALGVTNRWLGPDRGKLEVTKTLLNATEGSFTLVVERLGPLGWDEVDLGTEDVQVSDPNALTGEGYLQYTFTQGGAQTVVIEGLVSGTYRVRELDAGPRFTVAYTHEYGVQLVRGGTAALGVTNTCVEAALRIHKILEDPQGAGGAAQTFVFELQRWEEYDWQPVDLSGLTVGGEAAAVDENGNLTLQVVPGGEAEALVRGLEVGTYRVRELGAEGYTVLVEPGQIELVAGATGYVAVTNTPKAASSSSEGSSSEESSDGSSSEVSSEPTTTSGESTSQPTTSSEPSTTSESSTSVPTTTSSEAGSESTTSWGGSSSKVPSSSQGTSSSAPVSSGQSSWPVSSSAVAGSSSAPAGESSSEPEPPPVVPGSSTSRPPVRSSTTSVASTTTTSVAASQGPSEPGGPDGPAPDLSSSVPPTQPAGTSEPPAGEGRSGRRLTREELIEETGSIRLFGYDMPLGNLRIGAAWSLVNLMLSVLAILCGLVLLITAIVRRSQQRAAAEGEVGETMQTSRFGRGKRRVLAAVAGLVPLFLFLIVEDLLTPVALVNRWTPWILAAWLAHFGLLLFSLLRRKVREDEEPEEEPVG